MIKFKIIFIFICWLVFMVLPPSAFAHKVNIFAYAEGGSVYTESYFPDGRKVKGGKIEVYERGGAKLLDGTTDDNGQFNFKPSKRCDLEIVLNASMGHRNTCTISKDELSQPPDTDKETLPDTKTEGMQADIGQIQKIADIGQIQKIVDISLEKRLRPVMQKLTKMEEDKVSPKDIIGGIGYIFGIAGIAFFCLSSRKNG